MSETDCGFPIIKYNKEDSWFERGRKHGEAFAQGIKELIKIRKDLMQEKNPSLVDEKLDVLAKKQWDETAKMDQDLVEEMRGMAEGAGVSITDIVILNNYTDFRDINLPDEGCTTLIKSTHGRMLAGQTWDMHGSAKRYLCLIHVPEDEHTPEAKVLSLVGCVGLMGLNRHGCMIGVNNINTEKAVAGVIWPALVRKVLKEKDTLAMEKTLISQKVTSGHNYMIVDPKRGQMHEISPPAEDRLANIEVDKDELILHTNHCLGENVKKFETPTALNSTTHIRLELSEKKVGSVTSLESLYSLFTDHENHPKSICSHFQSGTQDPSMTCGGGAGDFAELKFSFWRGCPEYDDNFICRNFSIADSAENGSFFREF